MTAAVPFLDLSRMTAEVRDDVVAAWDELLLSGSFIGGHAVELFEEEWARYCGAEHAVGVANGTDAIQLALRALGVGPGDEVVVPANTFIATVEAVLIAGAVPRFADVDPETLLLTPQALAEQIRPRTRAVIPVHLYGQMADMPAIQAVAERAGLLVLEDAAQAQGATWCGRRAGSFGDAGCFSFYPGKNLGAFGDAGAVVTSDATVARDLRVLRDHGRAIGSHHDHVMVGTNSRLDALQAVVLSAKLKRLDGWNDARRAVMNQYLQSLDGDVVRPVRTAPEAVPVHHLAVVRTDDREAARSVLSEHGIGTSIHYPVPCHRQPAYQHLGDQALPAVEEAAREIVSLPMFPALDGSQVSRVCRALRCVASAGSRGRALVR